MSRPDPHESASAGASPTGRSIAGWQKLLAIFSLIVSVGGGGLMAAAALTGDAKTPAPTAAAGTDSAVRTGFAADGTDGGQVPGTAGDPRFLDEWSPTIFKLGFSFFAAFCMAYALRSFLKIGIIAIGLLLLALFGLQYAGLIDVNWSEWSDRYDSVTAWLSAQTSSFKGFIQGALPSSASAAVGFIAGFRRRG